MFDTKKDLNFLVLIFVGLMLCASVYFGLRSEQAGILNVSAEVELEKVPEVAQVRIGLRSELSSDQKTAYNQSADFAGSFTELLRSNNVDESEFKLENISVRKEYMPKEKGLDTDVFRSYVGFDVKIGPRSNASVSLSDIIAEAVRLGANDIGSLNYSFEDDKIFNERLRELASEQLLTKAHEIADLYGVKLGKIMSYSENNFGGGPMYISASREMMLDSADASVERVELNPGTQTVSMDVSATFEVK